MASEIEAELSNLVYEEYSVASPSKALHIFR